jgi:regulatory protein
MARILSRVFLEASVDDIDRLLDDLQGACYLSDQRFIEAYVHRYSRERGMNRIIFELKKRGIDDELLQDFFEKAQLSRSQELEYARQVWFKRFKGIKAKNQLDYQKQARFLAYRGFSSQTIRKLLSNISSSNDDMT